MPRWDYQCEHCGAREEREYPRRERAPEYILCRDCEPGSGAKMWIQAAKGSFVLKGAGFHKNDY